MAGTSKSDTPSVCSGDTELRPQTERVRSLYGEYKEGPKAGDCPVRCPEGDSLYQEYQQNTNIHSTPGIIVS